MSRKSKSGEVPFPLEGITILDFSVAAQGPICSQFFADMGAEVIKIEPLEGDFVRISSLGPGIDSAQFVGLNRNKKSLAVNLKDTRGLDIVRRLLPKTDVMLENFRPGVMDELGLGWEAVSRINPRIVFCSLSAYGEVGPLAHRRGGDPWAQAFTGVVAMQGNPGGPPYLAGAGFIDAEGAAIASTGILAALFWRERTGRGQKISSNLIVSGLVAQSTNFCYFAIDGLPMVKGGRGTGRGQFPYGAYTAKDGDVVTIFGQDDDEWATVCKMLGTEYLLENPKYATTEQRREHKLELYPVLDEAFSRKTRAEWADIFRQNKLRCDPCLTYQEMVEHPQFKALDLMVKMEHPVRGVVDTLCCPVKFHGIDRPPLANPAPILGESSRDILLGLGYTEEVIEKLHQDGVIGIPTPDMFERRQAKATSAYVTRDARQAAKKSRQRQP